MKIATKTTAPEAHNWNAAELVGPAEAARFLGVARLTVYRAMNGGGLPYIKIGGTRAIPLRALRAYKAKSKP